MSRLRDGVGNELLAIFRDDMFRTRRVPESKYYGTENGYEDSPENIDEHIDVMEFRALGRSIADRLDVIGIDPTTALAYLDDQFADRSSILRDPDYLATFDADLQARIVHEDSFRSSLTGSKWVEMLAASSEEVSGTVDRIPGSRTWLLDEIDYWDERYALRAVLLAFPDAEVVLDVTDINEGGYLRDSDLTSLSSTASAAISGMAGMHAPVVVLTEGRTDAEFLSTGLRILYPHLTDLIRFLDYERRPEGGVAALVRMVRSFAAAGIINRVIAIFDNDTAAADGLRGIRQTQFFPQTQIIRYPVLDLAKEYPTLGPPTVSSPAGYVSLADVNGLAGSIELYLGRDVLTRADGTLYPVQWSSFIAGMSQYQGEVIDKASIHESFRSKYALALQRPEVVKHQDWDGIRLILDDIRFAAVRAFGDYGRIEFGY